MSNILDSNGLQYVWNKIKAKFAEKTDIPTATSLTPEMDGIANAGSATTWAKGDHVHPTDTSRAPLASPAFTGTPTAPTPLSTDNSQKVATTEYVQTAIAGLDGATYTITQSQADGHTFTMTGSNGYSQSITIPDNNTTYDPATQSVNGLMSSTDKTKLDGFGSASDYALKSDITGVYRYKGSVATESLLPTTGMEHGDVYDIVAASSYGAPGMNVAWNEDKEAWDALGEKFQVTTITNQEIDEICV
jgi:hypothetical protein